MKPGTIVIVAAALLLAAPCFAGPGDEAPGSVELSRRPSRDLAPEVPLPRPIGTAVIFVSEDPQLVGFTRPAFSGNAGVLTLTMACQAEFAGSRMCTLDEIRKSTVIPEPPTGGGFAWVQNMATTDRVPDMNCQGWMSKATREMGSSIALDRDCYGGLKLSSCDSLLPVACCAREGFAR